MAGVAIAFAFCGWASWHIFAKFAMKHISPMGLQFVCSLSALLFAPIYGYLAIKQDVKFTAIGVGLSFCAYAVATLSALAYAYALLTVPVSQAVMLTAGYPALTCLVAVFLLNEPFSLQKFIGLALVLIGVMIVSG